MADTIKLNYLIGATPTTSILPVLIEKGLARAEKYRMYPPIINQALDGSQETQYKAFIRSMKLTTDILTSQQLTDYVNWYLDNARTIDYTIDGVTETGIIFIPPTEMEVLWYDDFKMSPYIEFDMEEGIARNGSSLPGSW